MSRATVLYIFMLVACAAGLWLILRVGSRLIAPTDFSGTWQVVRPPGGERPPEAPGPDAGDPVGGTMRVEQSGQFFRVQLEGGLSLDLKLAAEQFPAGRERKRVVLALAGGGWTLRAVGRRPDGPYDVDLRGGPAQGRYDFRVHRIGGIDLPPEPERAPPPETDPSDDATAHAATRPSATQPADTQPVATQPLATQPLATQPAATQRAATRSTASRPLTPALTRPASPPDAPGPVPSAAPVTTLPAYAP